MAKENQYITEVKFSFSNEEVRLAFVTEMMELLVDMKQLKHI